MMLMLKVCHSENVCSV